MLTLISPFDLQTACFISMEPSSLAHSEAVKFRRFHIIIQRPSCVTDETQIV